MLLRAISDTDDHKISKSFRVVLLQKKNKIQSLVECYLIFICSFTFFFFISILYTWDNSIFFISLERIPCCFNSLHNFSTLERVILHGALNPRTHDFTWSTQLSNAGKDATRSAKASRGWYPRGEIVFIKCYVSVT